MLPRPRSCSCQHFLASVTGSAITCPEIGTPPPPALCPPLQLGKACAPMLGAPALVQCRIRLARLAFTDDWQRSFQQHAQQMRRRRWQCSKLACAAVRPAGSAGPQPHSQPRGPPPGRSPQNHQGLHGAWRRWCGRRLVPAVHSGRHCSRARHCWGAPPGPAPP